MLLYVCFTRCTFSAGFSSSESIGCHIWEDICYESFEEGEFISLSQVFLMVLILFTKICPIDKETYLVIA